MDSKEIEQTLGDLDDKVTRLRALYEQFFMGIEKLEPQTPRKEVDRVIAQMRKIQLRNTAQRFRFQTIIQRYNTMQQHWGRTLREMEAGTFRRDVLRAAERFGVDDAVTALGKRRAAKMAAALEAKKKQQVEREKTRGGRSGDRGGEHEELEEAELVEDDLDDEAPTPPPQRPKPAAPQVWELHDPSEELTYVPPGAEPLAATGPSRAASINPFGGGPRAVTVQQMPRVRERTDEASAGLDATASYPSAAALHAAEGVEKKAAGGLRFGGGPRRASAEALNRLASALGGDALTAPAPSVTEPAPPPSQPRGATPSAAGFRVPSARPSQPTAVGATIPSGPPDFSSGGRKPLLSQPLDIDLAGLGPAPAAPPSRPSAEPPRTSAAPQGRKPLLSQPLDIDLAGLGPAPAPEPPRASSSGALKPPPARPSAPAPEPAPPREPGPPRERPAPAPRQAAPKPEPKPEPKPDPAGKDMSDQRMREIYSQYVQKRREHNEPTTNITYEKLSESLRSQTEKLKQKHASKKIDYEVVVKDGKTLIKPIVR